MRQMIGWKNLSLVVGCLLFLAGCQVGQDLSTNETATTQSGTSETVTAQSGTAERESWSCSDLWGGGLDKQDFLAFDQDLRTALSKQDAAATAMLVSFPLRINQDGGNFSLNNGAALQTRFAEIFPQQVRSAILNQNPETIHCNYQGINYGAGNVWVTIVGQGEAIRYAIFVVNLPDTDVGTRPLGTPNIEFVCHAEKYHIMIDSDASGKVRYRAWDTTHSLTDVPDAEVPSGIKRYEGTGFCAHTYWTFTEGNTEFTVNELGCFPDSSQPPEGARGQFSLSVAGKQQMTSWCY